jgi:hypothetical protein
MFLFDPRVGTGANLARMLAAEVSFNTADIAADSGDDALADAFWQMGASLSHPNSSGV